MAQIDLTTAVKAPWPFVQAAVDTDFQGFTIPEWATARVYVNAAAWLAYPQGGTPKTAAVPDSEEGVADGDAASGITHKLWLEAGWSTVDYPTFHGGAQKPTSQPWQFLIAAQAGTVDVRVELIDASQAR